MINGMMFVLNNGVNDKQYNADLFLQFSIFYALWAVAGLFRDLSSGRNCPTI